MGKTLDTVGDREKVVILDDAEFMKVVSFWVCLNFWSRTREREFQRERDSLGDI